MGCNGVQRDAEDQADPHRCVAEHMWAYSDLTERTERRAALLADADFQSYVAKMLPLLAKQESKLLVPAPFFRPP
ncbi:NIPSNAP family protein [Paraburkholderia acidiphila]|uniref:NIPSNAP domain-containing protein n=1 Tax=Paraburkholderia acidiphila TaxID=2571747 RepID=A0A7Z2JBI3_9BURK|nr:NIPSNAP family protein [Paraburkholderia acidiphila]QGZ56900.1 hypothetical protein FAZ97_18275 [Paraburkholderia acidiphila]